MFNNSVLQTKLGHAKKLQPHVLGGKILFDNQLSFVSGKGAMGKKAGRARGWVVTSGGGILSMKTTKHPNLV